MFFKIGQAICVGLYGWFGVLAAKKKPLPLIGLLLAHLCEYFLVARKVAEEKGISQLKAYVMSCSSLFFEIILQISSNEKL